MDLRSSIPPLFFTKQIKLFSGFSLPSVFNSCPIAVFAKQSQREGHRQTKKQVFLHSDAHKHQHCDAHHVNIICEVPRYYDQQFLCYTVQSFSAEPRD